MRMDLLGQVVCLALLGIQAVRHRPRAGAAVPGCVASGDALHIVQGRPPHLRTFGDGTASSEFCVA